MSTANIYNSEIFTEVLVKQEKKQLQFCMFAGILGYPGAIHYVKFIHHDECRLQNAVCMGHRGWFPGITHISEKDLHMLFAANIGQLQFLKNMHL